MAIFIALQRHTVYIYIYSVYRNTRLINQSEKQFNQFGNNKKREQYDIQNLNFHLRLGS